MESKDLIEKIMRRVLLGEPYRSDFNRWLLGKNEIELWEILLELEAYNR
jgi:hypothetical protein